MSDEPVILVTFFVFGALFGSFLNVVVHRLPRDIDIFRRTSFCPRCEAPVRWVHNVPIFGWLLLGGRCRDCGERISLRYPIVELVAGVLLALAVWRWDITWTAASAVVFAYAMLTLALIDADFRILPNAITLPGTVVGLLFSLVDPQISWLDSLLGIAVGGGLLYLVAWAYFKAREREGMGMGDVKMMMMVGAFVGWRGALLTIFIGSLLGTLFGAAAMALRGKSLQYALPFGTFLAVAAMIADTWGAELLRWYWTTFGVAG